MTISEKHRKVFSDALKNSIGTVPVPREIGSCLSCGSILAVTADRLDSFISVKCDGFKDGDDEAEWLAKHDPIVEARVDWPALSEWRAKNQIFMTPKPAPCPPVSPNDIGETAYC